MINPIASEAIFSATYVDNYIDSVENLPDDVQRQLSRIRDIDVQYRSKFRVETISCAMLQLKELILCFKSLDHLRDVDQYHEVWKTLESSGGDNTVNRRSRAIARMQASLILAQERGDEKMQIVNQLQELIDHKTRQLDLDQRNLDIKEEHQQLLAQRDNDDAPTPQKIARSQSPTRDVLTNAVSSLLGDASMTIGNVCSEVTTPTSERTAQPSAMVGNICGSGNGMQNNPSVLASNSSTAESQRSSTGKRSRRRHDTANSQSQIDAMCGNESNSASNEAAGSSNGADKNAINSGSTQHKVTTNIGNTIQKKSSSHGNAVGVLCAGNNGSAAAGAGTGNGATSNSNNAVKKKKRKARGAHGVTSHNTREDTPPPDLDPIDPDEPTYCLCDQVGFEQRNTLFDTISCYFIFHRFHLVR